MTNLFSFPLSFLNSKAKLRQYKIIHWILLLPFPHCFLANHFTLTVFGACFVCENACEGGRELTINTMPSPDSHIWRQHMAQPTYHYEMPEQTGNTKWWQTRIGWLSRKATPKCRCLAHVTHIDTNTDTDRDICTRVLARLLPIKIICTFFLLFFKCRSAKDALRKSLCVLKVWCKFSPMLLLMLCTI